MFSPELIWPLCLSGNEGYEGWYQDENGEWVYDESTIKTSTTTDSSVVKTANGSLENNKSTAETIDAKPKAVANGDVKKDVTSAETIKKDDSVKISEPAAAGKDQQNGEKLPPRPAGRYHHTYVCLEGQSNPQKRIPKKRNIVLNKPSIG